MSFSNVRRRIVPKISIRGIKEIVEFEGIFIREDCRLTTTFQIIVGLLFMVLGQIVMNGIIVKSFSNKYVWN